MMDFGRGAGMSRLRSVLGALCLMLPLLGLSVPEAAAQTSPSFCSAVELQNQAYALGVSVTDRVLPRATGGTGKITYSLSQALPTGLTFDDDADADDPIPTLSGTPRAIQAATTYTYTATDATPATASFTFTLAVQPVAFPRPFSNNTADAQLTQVYAQNVDIDDLVLPAAGTGTVTYTLEGPNATDDKLPTDPDYDPNLPAGLTFDPTTRTLSGTPTTEQTATTYTLTATDGDGNTDSLDLTIAVEPVVFRQPVANQIYVQGTTISTRLPAATAAGTTTYSIDPAEPAGLKFDPATRTLSGTPTATEKDIKLTATSGGKSTTLTFDITVEADAATADKTALLALYDDTDGDSCWVDATGWDTTAALSTWEGVTTDSNDRVTGLDLAYNQLAGALPGEVGSLSELRELTLQGNQLSGLPAQLGSLTNLIWLSLHTNELSGAIPPRLGQPGQPDMALSSHQPVERRNPRRLARIEQLEVSLSPSQPVERPPRPVGRVGPEQPESALAPRQRVERHYPRLVGRPGQPASSLSPSQPVERPHPHRFERLGQPDSYRPGLQQGHVLPAANAAYLVQRHHRAFWDRVPMRHYRPR